jgi:recombination protein RecA
MAATYTARNDGMRGGTVEREKALEVALLQIEKQFGKGSVMRMGVDGPADPVQAIPTGSLALDLALGIGGVPRGRVVEIYGPEASGKTTLALHIIAEAQRTGGIAAFVDAEHALDVTYARNLGVNTDELLISQPDTGEQALEIADMLVRSGAIDVIVVDSVAALVPRAEIEGEMGDSHVGLQARLMSQALRKLSGTISKSKTTAIFINQLREKIGVLFGSPETTSGGRALKFYASVRLDVRRIESLKDGPEVVGNRTRAKVVKNKLAPPFRSAEFDVIYGQGISKEGSLLDVGVDVGLIKKSGAWFTYDGDQLGQGRENARNFLRDNPELAREIEEKIKAQLGVGLAPTPPTPRPAPLPPTSTPIPPRPREQPRSRTSSEPDDGGRATRGGQETAGAAGGRGAAGRRAGGVGGRRPRRRPAAAHEPGPDPGRAAAAAGGTRLRGGRGRRDPRTAGTGGPGRRRGPGPDGRRGPGGAGPGRARDRRRAPRPRRRPGGGGTGRPRRRPGRGSRRPLPPGRRGPAGPARRPPRPDPAPAAGDLPGPPRLPARAGRVRRPGPGRLRLRLSLPVGQVVSLD